MSKWKKTKVSQFLFERQGKYKPDAPQVLGLKRIDKIDFHGNFHIANKSSKTNMILVNNGDLVISGINVSKGALGIYEGAEPVTATIHYSSYTFDENQIHIEYLKRFLKSPKFIELLKEQVRGGIKTEIKPKHILALEIFLPHIDEQRKIVEKFRRIETEDSELRAEISYQRALLKKLRQQILQDAVEGKLTASWREENPDNPDNEAAGDLLKRIATEKERLLKVKKIKKQKPLSAIIEKEKQFSLPKIWEWCRLDQIIYESPRNGYSPKTVDFKTDTKTLKLGATTKGTFDAREFKYINEAIEKNSYLWLAEGDILIQRSNSLDHVGISAIYNGKEAEFIYPDIMMKIRACKGVENTFLHRVLTSPYCREYFRSSATGAQKSMPKINQGIVSSTLIPLPSNKEQQAIVTKVEALFAICDQLEAQITQNQKHVNQLMQAVLKEAFTHTEDEAQAADNVIELKPAKNKQADYYKRTLLAAEIVDQLHKEPTFGHLKLQKMIFLCQKTQGMELPTNFLQQAAGPYDPQMARSLDTQLKEKQWYDYNGQATLKYQPLDAAGAHKDDYQKYFQSELDGIKRLIGLFRTKKSNEIEAVATLYACWEEILNSGVLFSKETLIEKFFAWSAEKRKFSERQVSQVITWMEKQGIYPKQSETVC